MEWIEAIGKAVEYMEEHITQELTCAQVAEQVHLSPFYFQKGFRLLCGFTVAEYIRKRRLSLAGGELASTGAKVIDVALKYGYDSPDSFAKAFTRFHGLTPSMARKDGATLRAFAPLNIKFSLEGGYLMDYQVVQKDSFTVVGARKTCKYEHAAEDIPLFWKEVLGAGSGLCGTYGINRDAQMGGEEFEYMIADPCDPGAQAPEGLHTQVIPAFTWAVFPCKGAMPMAMQEVNKRIFSEWLPACREYEIAAGYCIEVYEDPRKYPKGTADGGYQSQLWIPVKRRG